MTRQIPIPYFPTPPGEYSQRYLAEVTRAFSSYAQQLSNPGPVRSTDLTLTTQSGGVNSGKLTWNDTLKRLEVTVDGVKYPLGFDTLTFRTVTGAATITAVSDNVLLADASGGAVTVALPAAADATGRQFTIKKIDVAANAVTIDPDGAELIDGATTYVINAQYTSRTVASDGTQWWII
jgi:hypothetical protein